MYPSKPLKEYKNDYIVLSSNRDLHSLLSLPSLNIISIDPAVKNFAILLEVRTRTRVNTLVMSRTKFDDGPDAYLQLTEHLDKHHENTLRTNIVLIERQLPVNYHAIRISQHCATYFTVKYPHLIVVEVSSQLKTRELNAPPRMTKPERKKWSVQKAFELCDKYGDDSARITMKSMKGKLDDVADTKTQSEAFFTLTGYVT